MILDDYSQCRTEVRIELQPNPQACVIVLFFRAKVVSIWRLLNSEAQLRSRSD